MSMRETSHRSSLIAQHSTAGYLGLHGISAWFVVMLEAILAASTLVIVLLLVARDIRLA